MATGAPALSSLDAAALTRTHWKIWLLPALDVNPAGQSRDDLGAA